MIVIFLSCILFGHFSVDQTQGKFYIIETEDGPKKSEHDAEYGENYSDEQGFRYENNQRPKQYGPMAQVVKPYEKTPQTVNVYEKEPQTIKPYGSESQPVKPYGIYTTTPKPYRRDTVKAYGTELHPVKA